METYYLTLLSSNMKWRLLKPHETFYDENTNSTDNHTLIKNVDRDNVSIVCTAFLNCWVRGGQGVEPSPPESIRIGRIENFATQW